MAKPEVNFNLGSSKLFSTLNLIVIGVVLFILVLIIVFIPEREKEKFRPPIYSSYPYHDPPSYRRHQMYYLYM